MTRLVFLGVLLCVFVFRGAYGFQCYFGDGFDVSGTSQLRDKECIPGISKCVKKIEKIHTSYRHIYDCASREEVILNDGCKYQYQSSGLGGSGGNGGLGSSGSYYQDDQICVCSTNLCNGSERISGFGMMAAIVMATTTMKFLC